MKVRGTTVTSLVIGSLMLMWASAPAAQSQQLDTQSIKPYRDLNQSFLSLYHMQNPMIDAELPLIVVIRSETMSAIEPTLTTTYTLASEIEEIKSALHATLAYQGLMTVAAQTPSDTVWVDVAKFDANLSELEKLVTGSSADAITRSATLAALREFRSGTAKVLAQRHVTQEQTIAVLHAARPHVMQAVAKIGDSSLEQMTAVLRAIREKVSPEVWDKVVVVVPGPATARVDNLAVMAAMLVLGEDQLGHRIFYSEGVYDDTGIKAFVQMLMRDKQFSGMLFENPYRMWRDLFADTSRKYIDRDYFASPAQQK